MKKLSKQEISKYFSEMAKKRHKKMTKEERVSMTMPIKIQIFGFDDKKEFVDNKA